MNDWEAYALWLGQKHSQRLWRELVSNSMVVISGFLIHCERQRTSEPWEFDGDDVEAAMEEIWSSGTVAPAQEGGVGEAHASDGDGEAAESEIDDGNEAIIQREQPSCRGVPRLMPYPPYLDVTHLKQLTDDWSTQCVVCKVYGKKSRNDHHWSECDSLQGGKEKMNEAVHFLNDITFAKFVHCKWCYRPQALCEIWKRSLNKQGLVAFHKKPGADCKFGRVVLEAAAALLAFGATDNLEEWRREGTLVDMKQQMGKKYKRGELEFSGLFMYFYKWA
ncbi:hypothetical protein E4U61_007962 [Claviceps capensis]|nr:hypothetical protein E4U61_007962 [Claviceps capensis]